MASKILNYTITYYDTILLKTFRGIDLRKCNGKVERNHQKDASPKKLQKKGTPDH